MSVRSISLVIRATIPFAVKNAALSLLQVAHDAGAQKKGPWKEPDCKVCASGGASALLLGPEGFSSDVCPVAA